MAHDMSRKSRKQILKLYFTSFFKGIQTPIPQYILIQGPKLFRFREDHQTIHHSTSFFQHKALENYFPHPPLSPLNPSSFTISCVLNFNSSRDENKSYLTSESTELEHFSLTEKHWWNALWFSVHFTVLHQFHNPVLHIAFRKENLISAIWYRISWILIWKYCLSVKIYWVNEEEEER